VNSQKFNITHLAQWLPFLCVTGQANRRVVYEKLDFRASAYGKSAKLAEIEIALGMIVPTTA